MHRNQFSKAVWHLSRTELVLLSLLALITFGAHIPVLCAGFGEPDAARLANDAILWVRTGGIDLNSVEYRYRTSILYIYVLKELVELVGDLEYFPELINLIHIFVVSVGAFSLYLVGRLVAPPVGAGFGLILFLFMPGTWVALNYAFPLLPGFIFFAIATLFLTSSIRSCDRLSALVFSMCALMCFVVAFGFKVDLILYLVTLPLIANLGKNLTEKLIQNRTLVVLLVPIAAFFIVIVISEIMVPAAPKFEQAASDWAGKFPVEIGAAFEIDNQEIVFSSVGVAFIGLILASVIPLLRSPENRRILIVALVWFLPTTAFWSLRELNSVRHNIVPWFYLLVAGGTAVTMLRSRVSIAFAIATILILINSIVGFRFQVHGPNSPYSANLWHLAKSWNCNVLDSHELAASFSQASVQDFDGKVFIGDGATAYVTYELLRAYPKSIMGQSGAVVAMDGSQKNKNRAIRVEYTMDVAKARERASYWRERGWYISSNYSSVELTP